MASHRDASGASTPIRIANHLLRAVDEYLEHDSLYDGRREVIEAALREFLQKHKNARVLRPARPASPEEDPEDPLGGGRAERTKRRP